MVKMGGFGRFDHTREPLPLDKQVAARGNRDTLYSIAVFDLAAGPVTITLPDAGERFMSMIAIDEEHYVHAVVYGAGSYTYDQATIGTRLCTDGPAHAGRPGPVRRPRPGTRPARCGPGSPGQSRPVRGAGLGPCQPRQSARRAAGAQLDPAGPAGSLRQPGPGRPGAPPDRDCYGVGWQPGQGRRVSQHHTRTQRRHDRPHTHRRRRARR